MRRPWRIPALLVLIGLLVAGIVVQRRTTAETSAISIDAAVPVVAAGDASGSTWYCAAGTATSAAEGFAEQTIIVSNSSDRESTGFVTVHSDSGAQTSRPLTVPPHGSATFRSSEILKAPWAAVVVEASGGGVAVTQEVRGPSGRSVADCSSSSSPVWWFPAGTSRAGARLLLTLFNPFPGEATVDITFDTEDGTRTPQQFQGLVVRGGHVSVVDISAVVTLRERVSMSVVARSGRLVAMGLQTTDGRNATESGLTFVPGSSVTAPVWFFPVSTPVALAADEIVSVINTGDTDAEVQVQVQLDDPAVNGTVEPFVVSVPAQRSIEVDLGADARVPTSVGHWLIVRATGGEPLVVARTIGAVRTASTGGLASTLGVPVVATRWIGGVPLATATSSALLSVVNPHASRRATVTVRVHGDGRVSDVARMVAVVIPPGQRTVIDLAKVFTTRPTGPWEVVSDQPVVAGQWFTFSSPIDFSTVGAYPVAGTQSSPGPVADPDTPHDGGAAPRSDDSVPGATTTSTTAAPTAAPTASTTTTVAAVN
ncbi:MAG: DUF5719 family protein [Acidimicrobiia bacterium]